MTQENEINAAQDENSCASAEYSARDIRILGEIEAVRLRPGMYIGGTDAQGLHHLLYEIVYNSIDEAMAGFCDRVMVTIHTDNSITVSDNGRGIPVDIVPEMDITALEAVMTHLHAGAKFGGLTYRISSGLHGVGASVVNALSTCLTADVRRDGKIHRQEYDRGIPRGDIHIIGDTKETGTTITFLADSEIFDPVSYNFDTVCKRLRELSYLNKGVEIGVRDEDSDREKAFYFEGGMSSYVRCLNRDHSVLHPTPIHLQATIASTVVEVALQYNSGVAELTTSFANCINTREGGSHLTGFRSALTRVINDYARKNKFIKDSDPNVTGDDVREGLVAIINTKLPDPQFEGQTKTRLVNPEIKAHVESVVGEGLTFYMEQHPEESRAIVNKCLISAKAREAARRARDLIFKKNAFETSTLPGKLANCSEKNPAFCELYLVEGDSAGGSAKQGRDRYFQAILPLRGKILNVEKATQDKLVEHEEIRAIVTAAGTNIDEDFDLTRLRYHRIIIMTDADVDGSHIRTLLLTFFYRHMPELILNGHLFIAQPPLYRIQAGKQHTWIYSEQAKEEKLKELKDNKYVIQRYKGLGEMNPEQLWETTMNPATRTLLEVEVGDAITADQTFVTLMGSEVLPRRRFILAHAHSVKNLDI